MANPANESTLPHDSRGPDPTGPDPPDPFIQYYLKNPVKPFESVVKDGPIEAYYFFLFDGKVHKCCIDRARKLVKMWKDFKMVPYQYIKGRHPESLKNWNSNRFFSDLYMRVNWNVEMDTDLFNTFGIFKINLGYLGVEDAGLKKFMSFMVPFTGDAFYFGAFLGASEKKWSLEIDSLKSFIDQELNKRPLVVAAYKSLDETSNSIFKKTTVTIQDKQRILELEMEIQKIKEQEKIDPTGENYIKITDSIHRIKQLELRTTNEVDHIHDIYTHFTSQTCFALSPKFSTKPMIKKGGKMKSKKVKRGLSRLAHARARNDLAHKMKNTGGTLVTIVESYDTQQCSECFHRTHVGNSDVYSCSYYKCRLKAYRDDSTWTTLKKVLIRLLECRRKGVGASEDEDVEVDVVDEDGDGEDEVDQVVEEEEEAVVVGIKRKGKVAVGARKKVDTQMANNAQCDDSN